MFSADVTYQNYDGQTITQKIYFHLTKLDIMDMDVEKNGGYKAYLEEMIRSENKQEIYDAFKTLVLKSYGVKLPDGRFYKDDIETKVFKSSEAFSEFMFMLSQDENLQVQFVNGIFPKFNNQNSTRTQGSEPKVIDVTPPSIAEVPKEYSKEDIDRIVKAELERIHSEKKADANVAVEVGNTGTV